MAVDTPAKIAVLGAGPIGIEAALYARFLGYEVVIYERGRVGEHLRKWGHVTMFSPFGMNASPLGLAALTAHDEEYAAPAADALLTGEAFVRQYLEPLSQTDLLADSMRLSHEVLAVGRENYLKGDLPGREERGDYDFRLLVRDATGREFIDNADVVLDTTGVWGQPNWLGCAGIPAPGERELRPQIEYHLPDIAGARREHYDGMHTLVIGRGYSAATNVVALAKLAQETPGTRTTWITRGSATAEQSGPMFVIPDDRLAARAELALSANAACVDPKSGVTYWPQTDVEAIGYDRERAVYSVEVSGEHAGTFEFDRLIANVGYRPDDRLYAELQVHQCYATSGPMKLAAALQGVTSADCLDQTTHGAATLVNPEPNFYILGHKSYGRNPTFLLATGLRQIVEVFSIIGDRATLDLYATAPQLPR
jgi:thioredoxin reductase